MKVKWWLWIMDCNEGKVKWRKNKTKKSINEQKVRKNIVILPSHNKKKPAVASCISVKGISYLCGIFGCSKDF